MLVKKENIIFPKDFELNDGIMRYRHKNRNLSFPFDMKKDIEFHALPYKNMGEGDRLILLVKIKESVLPLKYRKDEDCLIISQLLNCEFVVDGVKYISSNFRPFSFLYSEYEDLLNNPQEIPNCFIEVFNV